MRALAGGDDYELCFTAPAGQRDHINAISASRGIALTRVGEMHAGSTHVTILDADGEPMKICNAGFDHFAP
jgi:thiamine-monophosphate kinase